MTISFWLERFGKSNHLGLLISSVLAVCPSSTHNKSNAEPTHQPCCRSLNVLRGPNDHITQYSSEIIAWSSCTEIFENFNKILYCSGLAIGLAVELATEVVVIPM